MFHEINLKKYLLISLIVSLGISAFLGIIIFLLGNFGVFQVRILFTTLTIGGFSLTALSCASLLEKNTFSKFASIGIILSVAGFFFLTSFIWGISNWSWEVMMVSIVLAFSTAHASLLLLIKSDKTIVNASLITTLIFISLVAFELIILVFMEFENDISDFWYRMLGVFAILDVLGTIVTPILSKVTSS